LVGLVVFIVLGYLHAMLVPAVTAPGSLIGTFTVRLALSFSINILTLLVLVLAIGLVVNDAIGISLSSRSAYKPPDRVRFT